MAILTRFILILLILCGLTFAIYFLWQRQPKARVETQSQQMQTVVKPEDEKNKMAQSFLTLPKTDEILISPDLEIKGSLEKTKTVIVLSNTVNQIFSANDNGTFETTLKLTNGFGLYKIIALDSGFNELKNITIPVYFPQDNTANAINFQAGVVKKIFNRTITITSQDDEHELETSDSTTYTLLSGNSGQSKNVADKDIRVGDYILAAGKITNKKLKAQTVEIYRDNKPAVSKNYAVVKVITPAKNNKFSALSTGKNIEFTIDKMTQLYEADKKITSASLKKDVTAIVIFTESDGKAIANFIQII